MAEQKIGLYLRLSRDDERAGESMSIENQRSYLLQYVHSRGWSAEKIYVDDGFTGTNFDRPSFQRLLGDIDGGRVNTVITKDLSRLGRDQIGTAYYYQIYFPKHQVRYIAVAEGFDTAESGATSALFPFLAAANDFYTADISRKVRSALSTRKREGKFIGATPPLGYQKDPQERGHLIVEPQGAEIVRQVFALYLAVGSVVGVAKTLTEQGVPTPSQCKTGGQTQTRFPGLWSDTMVRRILTNPTYAGHLTQNRREKLNYKVEQRISLPKSDWIIVPNTHEPLVVQAAFDQVQALLAVRSYTPRRSEGGHLLTGLAFCADCGSPMTYLRQGEGHTYLVCQGYRKGGRLGLCTAHCVREDQVHRAIETELQRLASQVNAGQLLDALCKQRPSNAAERQAKSAQQKLEQLNAVLEQLYQDRADGVLMGQEFQVLLARNRAERAKWERLIGQKPIVPPEREVLAVKLQQFLSFDSLDRVSAVSLVERALIHEDKTLELFFRFKKPD